jgi:glycosylphosphatidylinositol phospholipase D
MLGVLLCLFSLQPYVSAAGLNTHTYVGYRTATHYGHIPLAASENATKYNAAIQKNIGAVMGGADFPDFGYACGKDHDAGEAAHWPGWHESAVKYVRAKPDFISGQWTEETEELIAFIFGVSVHYIADEFFEGLTGKLGRGQGLVEQLGAMNLNNSGIGDNSESSANVGGDFFTAWGFDEAKIQPFKRYFPTQAIVDIFHAYDNPQFPKGFKDVTLFSIEECKVIFDLGTWAEKNFGPALLEQITKDTPFLEERYQDLPIGGVDDMAVWASFEWARLANWFDVGPPSPAGPRVDVDGQDEDMDASERWVQILSNKLRPFRNHSDTLLALDMRDLQPRLSLVDPASPWSGMQINLDPDVKTNAIVHVDVDKVYTPEVAAVLVRVMQAMMEAVEEIMGAKMPGREGNDKGDGDFQLQGHVIRTSTTTTTTSVATATAAIPPVSGTHQVGYLGHALATGDFDGDGVTDLAAGAYGACGTGGIGENDDQCSRPQQGLVQVRYGFGANTSGAVTELGGAQVIHGRYGWALTTLDYNKDGIDDLVVAAPFASDRDPHADPPVPRNTTPSPRYQGRVYVHFGSKTNGLASKPDVTIATTDDLTMLGLTLHSLDLDGDGTNDLLVGCPQSSAYPSGNDPNQYIHRGTVMGFLSKPTPSKAVPDARAAADLVIDGGGNYDWLGQGVAITQVESNTTGVSRLLLLGAPGYRNKENGTVGRVYAHQISAANATASASSSATQARTLQSEILFTITGTEHAAEFGWSLGMSEAGKDDSSAALLAVAAPAAGRHHDIFPPPPIADRQHFRGGKVSVMQLTSAFVTSAVAAPDHDLLDSELPLAATVLGTSMGRLGTYTNFITTDTPQLVLGAPMSSPEALKSISLLGPRNAGALYVIPTAKLSGGVVIEDASSVATTLNMAGKRTRARLGTTAALVQVQSQSNSSGASTLLVVGSPFADTTSGVSEGIADDIEMGGVLDTAVLLLRN